MVKRKSKLSTNGATKSSKLNKHMIHAVSKESDASLSLLPAEPVSSNASPIDYTLIGYSPDRPARIYCDGIFDLFHYGHARALEQAKKLRPFVYLLVGVCSDVLTHAKKGKTVLYDYERYESLRHCKWVDEVIESAPWVIDQEFLDQHDIDFVAHDDIPYGGEGVHDIYAFVKGQGRFLATKRTEGISTSDLITRIVRGFDDYVRRNLERGYSPKELNISFLKRHELEMKKHVSDFKGKLSQSLKAGEGSIKQNWEGSKGELLKVFHTWESTSPVWVKDFISLFDVNGPVGKIFRREKKIKMVDSAAEESSADEQSSISSLS